MKWRLHWRLVESDNRLLNIVNSIRHGKGWPLWQEHKHNDEEGTYLYGNTPYMSGKFASLNYKPELEDYRHISLQDFFNLVYTTNENNKTAYQEEGQGQEDWGTVRQSIALTSNTGKTSSITQLQNTVDKQDRRHPSKRRDLIGKPYEQKLCERYSR